MDDHYRIVKTVQAAGVGASGDMHEFRVAPHSNDVTAIVTVYRPRQYDLTTNPKYNVQHGMGWIVEGIFQEVNIDTGELLFEWRSLDHVDPRESRVMPGTTDTSGDGLRERTPWDYFHLNSVDKNEQGDYLVSGRHVSAIYKISGHDGHVLWQLGGNHPTFQSVGLNFSYQHHVQWVSENNTHTVLTMYDNASNNYRQTEDFSHGKIVAIDHIASTATLLKKWTAPEARGGLLSTSQGSMQLLPDGSCHIGWGEFPYFSEHTDDNVTVLYAKVASRPSNVMIYRSGKYNWTATPSAQPALYAYSKEGGNRTSFWVSWNGATEVQRWRFYTNDTSVNGKFHLAGTVEHTGFETEFHLSDRPALWSYAEALDRKGHVLASSEIAHTLVPSDTLRPFCDDTGCDNTKRVPEANETPADAKIDLPETSQLSSDRGFDTSHYYMGVTFSSSSSSSSSSWTSGSTLSTTVHRTQRDRGMLWIGSALMLAFAGLVMVFFLRRSGSSLRGGLQSGVVQLLALASNVMVYVVRFASWSRFLGPYTRLRGNEDQNGDVHHYQRKPGSPKPEESSLDD